MKKELEQELKNKLTEIYSEKASDARIDELAKKLAGVIENTEENFDEVLFFVDEFEGGSSDADRFERIMAFILEELTVNKENAQRLFEFFQHCYTAIVYLYLISDFCDFLTEEQKGELPLTCPFLYARRP